jgi:hypothetical protein
MKVHATPIITELNNLAHEKKHNLGLIVSTASVVLIVVTIYSLYLQIKHTKLELQKFEDEERSYHITKK